MDAGSDHCSAAKGSAIDVEVAGSGPVSCCSSIPSSFLTMFSSRPCLSLFPLFLWLPHILQYALYSVIVSFVF